MGYYKPIIVIYIYIHIISHQFHHICLFIIFHLIIFLSCLTCILYFPVFHFIYCFKPLNSLEADFTALEFTLNIWMWIHIIIFAYIRYVNHFHQHCLLKVPCLILYHLFWIFILAWYWKDKLTNSNLPLPLI